MSEQNIFITTMPSSRPADYYLGYMEGSVFVDFNNEGDQNVVLVRISFDGYGCCDLKKPSIPLDKEDSNTFKRLIREQVSDQELMLNLVKKAVRLNKELIWNDALQEYFLI